MAVHLRYFDFKQTLPIHHQVVCMILVIYTCVYKYIYNALLRNSIQPKSDNILRKNQNGFRRDRSTISQMLTIRRILEGVRAKNLQATILFVDFTKAFDSIHRGKMEQILLAYGIPNETVVAITILYRNTKVKGRSPGGDTDYLDLVAGVLQGDTLAHTSLSSVKTTCLEHRLIKWKKTASRWQRKEAEGTP